MLLLHPSSLLSINAIPSLGSVLSFLPLVQGTKVVDESHDQDTTDLHKCISFIHDVTPDLDKSKVSFII